MPIIVNDLLEFQSMTSNVDQKYFWQKVFLIKKYMYFCPQRQT